MINATIVAGVLVLLGIVGVVVPALPGPVLALIGIAVWAIASGYFVAWATLVIAAGIVVVGSVVQYLVVRRRLRDVPVPRGIIVAGAVLGSVGFFVIPLVGVVPGYVLGVHLAELARLRGTEPAWPATRQALAAGGWGVVVELATAWILASLWILAVGLGPLLLA